METPECIVDNSHRAIYVKIFFFRFGDLHTLEGNTCTGSRFHQLCGLSVYWPKLRAVYCYFFSSTENGRFNRLFFT